MRSKRIAILLSALLAVMSLGASSSCAWEFSMNGTFNYIYEQYSQTGAAGFFGSYNVDKSTGSTLIPGR